MEILDRVFPAASTDQCCWLLGCAGTVASNVFAAGGTKLTLRVGNWAPNPDRAAAAVDPEVWVPGWDAATDQVVLECLTEVHPAAGFEPGQMDPFKIDIWAPSDGKLHPSRIVDVLKNFEQIPLVGARAANRAVFSLRSTDAYYSIAKIVSAALGTIVVHGGMSMGLELRRGPGAVDRFSRMVVEHSGKVVEQRNPDGSVVKVPVQRSRSVMVEEVVAPVYLIIDSAEVVSPAEIASIQSKESPYSPVWTLASLLTGKYAKGGEAKS
jgi:hypothetical protein